MKEPYVGAIVQYYPDRRLQEFHDKGHGVVLPAIITKVWDEVVNLRVCPTVNLRILLDSSCNPPFVFGAKYSEGGEQDTWRWPS